MLHALLLAIGQLGDPAFRSPLIKGVLGSAVALGLLLWGAVALAAELASDAPGWISWAAQGLGAVAGLVLAWWLFLPVAVAIASLFVGSVAAAVEQRHYPWLPPPAGASIGAQAAWGIGFALRMLMLQLILLPLILLLPGVGFGIALVVSARALGVGLFESAAQLRMGVEAARRERRARRWDVWGLGLVLALIGLLPFLGLLVPVLGTAASVHILHRSAGGNAHEFRG
jgi:CysZ protein